MTNHITARQQTHPPTGPASEPSLGLVLRVAAGVWSVVAWLAVLDLVVTAFINRAPLPSWRALVPSLAEWYLWVPLTPVVVWLGARFPITRRRPWTAYVPHVAGILVASGLRGAVYASTAIGIEHAPIPVPAREYLWRVTLGFLPVAAILYGGILAVAAAAGYARRSRAGELRAAQLEGQLAKAELAALRAHLHPHFLFNALHSVGALVRVHEPETAVSVIAELSDLLRYLLQRNAPEEVTLAEELAFVRRYLAIEQVRFSDRLRICWDIAPDAEDAVVPRLLLQPLVENAVRHGLARSTTAGVIGVVVRRAGPSLDITVRDDGPGPSRAAAGADGSLGWGLAGTDARLKRAYGPDAGVTLRAAQGGGAIAAVRLPYRSAQGAGVPVAADA